MSYQVKKYKGIAVSYLPHLDGGGTWFGQDYVPVVDYLLGRVDRAFEFCAGPGFIGFSLLAHQLCRSLCLADINPEAVEVARDTIQRNSLQDSVSVYQSDALDQIPGEEKWDLVVSNPPHFKDQHSGSIRHHDHDWTIHRRFYKGLKDHLQPGGVVLIQENFRGSQETDFVEMIASAGLAYGGAFMWAEPGRRDYLDTFYFVLSQRSEDQRVKGRARNGPMIDCSEPPAVVDVDLMAGRPAEIHLKAFRRYRFRFSNQLGRDVVLLTFALKLHWAARFLRTFGTVAADSREASFPFHFYPGRYVMKDEQTREILMRIGVS